MLEVNEHKVEALADYAHEAWSGWMRYLFSKCEPGPDGALVIPPWAVRRWQRQLQTDYEDLPEEEKSSDRIEARKMLVTMSAFDDVWGSDG